MRQDVDNTEPTYVQDFTTAKTLAEAKLVPDGITWDDYTPDDWGVKKASQATIRNNQLVMAMDKRSEPKTFKGDRNQHVRQYDTTWVRQTGVALIDEGAIEVTARMPMNVPGFWPCIWVLFPKDGNGIRPTGEIDIAEAWGPLGSNPNPTAVAFPNRFMSSLHFNSANHANSVSKVSPITSYDLSNEFHKYGLIKTNEEVIYYLDDIEVTRVNRSQNKELWDASFPKGKSMYLMFSVQCGSVWYGLPNEQTPDHTELVIDQIKIWDFHA